jgi:hypothetical protein
MTELLYTPKRVMARLDKYKVDYDTVIIVGWSRAISVAQKREYEDNGYLFMVSGDQNDHNFLSRQRAIMELAYHSLSFSFGTHVGYFLALGISHEIINLFDKNDPDFSNENWFLYLMLSYSELKEDDFGLIHQIIA